MSGTQNLKAVATGNTAAAANPAVAFKSMLESRKTEIQAALPRHITADRVIRLALTEFSKNPSLRECTQQSIYSGIIQASQLGLEIGVLGQAYLVPYNNKIKGRDGKPDTFRKEAQFIPGYKGLISLARRSGEVSSIETHIVYDNDAFELTLGIESKVTHKPNLDGDRGKARLVYGVAHFKDGGHHFEWMSISDVNRIRARSKAKDNGPWVTDFEQMVRKTLVRRMANYLPMSIELAAAIEVDAAAAAGKSASIDGDFSVVTSEDSEPAETETPAALVDTNTGEISPLAGIAAELREKADAEAAAQAVAAQSGDPASDEPRKPEAKARAKAPPAAPTYAQILDKLTKAHKAKDVDLLDAHADLIKSLADETQQMELTHEYQRMRAEITNT